MNLSAQKNILFSIEVLNIFENGEASNKVGVANRRQETMIHYSEESERRHYQI